MKKTPKATYIVFAVLTVLLILFLLGVFEQRSEPEPKEDEVSLVGAEDIRSLAFGVSQKSVVASLSDPSNVNVAREIEKSQPKESVLYRYSVQLGNRESNRCRYYPNGRWTICFDDDLVTLVSSERSSLVGSKVTGYGLIQRMLRDVTLPESISDESLSLYKGLPKYRFQAKLHESSKCIRKSEGNESWRYCFSDGRIASVTLLVKTNKRVKSLEQLIDNTPKVDVSNRMFLRKSPRKSDPVTLGSLASDKCLSYETEESGRVNDWMLCFRGDRLISKERLAQKGQGRLVLTRGS